MKKMSIAVKKMVLAYPVVSIIILLVIPIIVYLIVLIIDTSYDVPLDTVLNWETSLNYFGTVYGSLLGFLGVIITILYTQKQVTKQRKEADLIRLSDNAITVMPYMHIEYKSQSQYRSYDRYVLSLQDKHKSIELSKTIFINLDFKNKGRGSMIDLELFNSVISSNKTDRQSNSDKYLKKDFLDISEQLNLSLEIKYSPKEKSGQHFYVEIHFEYKDVFFNRYKEKHDLNFKIVDSNLYFVASYLIYKEVFNPKGIPLQIGIDSIDTVPTI